MLFKKTEKMFRENADTNPPHSLFVGKRMGRIFFELGENGLFWGFSPVHIPQESGGGA